MKAFFKVLVVAVLASAIGLTGCNKESESTTAQKQTTPTNAKATAEVIALMLPTLTDVELTKGEPKSGRVTGITDKQLTIELSGKADSIAIKDIKRVKFKREAPLPRGSEIRLRNQSEIWRVTPLMAFQIKDSSKGQAEVLLSSVVKEKQPPPDPLGEASSFEVEEIRFNSKSPGTMWLKVTGAN